MQIEMPGDADEAGAKTTAELNKARRTRRNGPDDAAATADKLDQAQDVTKRGAVTPAQHEGDGWGDTPAQMRES